MRESSHRLDKPEQEDVKTAGAAEEAESETKFAGGKPPPVAGAFADKASASTLAYEEDDNERELKQKVGKLVATKFGGDYRKAFDHYGKDGSVGKSDLVKLLSDAGIGNGLTRGVWAGKIIDRLDQNGDAGIEWTEFESVFRAAA